MSYDTYHLFVYGSLRRGFRSPAYEYISRFFEFVGEARVKGKLFDMGNFPAGVPADDESYIIGELYCIKQENEFPWAIGQLDDYEGVTVEPDEVQLYKREVTPVLINGQWLPAWIYWYKGQTTSYTRIESGDMLEYLQQQNNSA